MKSKVRKLLDQLGKYECSVSRGTVAVFVYLLIEFVCLSVSQSVSQSVTQSASRQTE